MNNVISFEQPETWLTLIDSVLNDRSDYIARLQKSGIGYSHWDCSGLKVIFGDQELTDILENIEQALDGYSLRIYHGCRLDDGQDPTISGLSASSVRGIEACLIKLAERDAVLKDYLPEIRKATQDSFNRRAADNRDNQIWFAIRKQEMIEDGGVYIVFGSEYRLLILNGINDKLSQRLLLYGTPAIVVIHLPFDDHLKSFRQYAAKYLFALWIHYHMNFPNNEIPAGFACWINRNVEANFIQHIERPVRVYDHYNSNARWYTWEEMVFKD